MNVDLFFVLLIAVLMSDRRDTVPVPEKRQRVRFTNYRPPRQRRQAFLPRNL